ncbi:hypothetical protein [Pseudooceanicola marinus]|uniref:hypothetical protein n=1 Tax=Pseudooceanicola marinus TaxID=396013 RepID=UPI001CD3EC6D|nr:hypothetical protein [Pseudooceanicola marinus]MCA1337479.1 hypothetical protein [Pseudooceanicola marinus]
MEIELSSEMIQGVAPCLFDWLRLGSLAWGDEIGFGDGPKHPETFILRLVNAQLPMSATDALPTLAFEIMLKMPPMAGLGKLRCSGDQPGEWPDWAGSDFQSCHRSPLRDTCFLRKARVRSPS